MSYHSKIMNIPVTLTTFPGELAIAHKFGHRDARHAAAEIALQADAEIERLREALKVMCNVWATVCDIRGWDRDHMQQYVDACAALKEKS